MFATHHSHVCIKMQKSKPTQLILVMFDFQLSKFVSWECHDLISHYGHFWNQSEAPYSSRDTNWTNESNRWQDVTWSVLALWWQDDIWPELGHLHEELSQPMWSRFRLAGIAAFFSNYQMLCFRLKENAGSVSTKGATFDTTIIINYVW